MTNEEAIIDIRENIQPIVGGKSLDIAISAIQKQTPKRVELYKHNGDFKWENYPCPCCGEMLGLKVNKRYVKFCPNCGQALDWSDSK